LLFVGLSAGIFVIDDDLENPNFALCGWEVYLLMMRDQKLGICSEELRSGKK
jgi:hypothetical protein